MDETRAVARLPSLDIEIEHRRLPEEDAEELRVTIRGAPSLNAATGLLQSAALWPWLALSPLLAWQQALQAVWAPWLPPPGRLTAERPQVPSPGRRTGANVHPFPGSPKDA
jgi:hypothetical protein